MPSGAPNTNRCSHTDETYLDANARCLETVLVVNTWLVALCRVSSHTHQCMGSVVEHPAVSPPQRCQWMTEPRLSVTTKWIYFGKATVTICVPSKWQMSGDHSQSCCNSILGLICYHCNVFGWSRRPIQSLFHPAAYQR